MIMVKGSRFLTTARLTIYLFTFLLCFNYCEKLPAIYVWPTLVARPSHQSQMELFFTSLHFNQQREHYRWEILEEITCTRNLGRKNRE